VDLSDETVGYFEHARAVAVAVPTVRDRYVSGCSIRLDLLIWIQVLDGVAMPLVVVVTEVINRRFCAMPAIAGHCRPGELEGQAKQQQDGEPTTHDDRV
jgi:hypothetical protein